MMVAVNMSFPFSLFDNYIITHAAGRVKYFFKNFFEIITLFLEYSQTRIIAPGSRR